MANNLLTGLLGFAILAVLVFIAVHLLTQPTHDDSGTTIIYPSWRPWRPQPRPPRPPHPPHPPHPRPPQPTPQPVRPIIGGCAGTRYGCCADGRTAKKDSSGTNCLLY